MSMGKHHAAKCVGNGKAMTTKEALEKGFPCDCDGFHTFGELYEHRIELFIALCRCFIVDGCNESWRSKVHSDGTSYEGWFILGIGKKKGKQITYHIPIDYWTRCSFAETLEKAPEWDGHTSSMALERLKKL